MPRVLGISQEKLEIHNERGTLEKSVRIPTRQNSRVIPRAEFERIGVDHPELRHPRLAPIHLHPHFDPPIDRYHPGTFSTRSWIYIVPPSCIFSTITWNSTRWRTIGSFANWLYVRTLNVSFMWLENCSLPWPTSNNYLGEFMRLASSYG